MKIFISSTSRPAAPLRTKYIRIVSIQRTVCAHGTSDHPDFHIIQLLQFLLQSVAVKC